MPVPTRGDSSQAAQIDRLDSGPEAGSSNPLYVYSSYFRFHLFYAFNRVQPLVQRQDKFSRAKKQKIEFTEAHIPDNLRSASSSQQKKWLKQMNRHQSGFVSNPSIPPGSAAAKFADTFIPSRHGNKKLKPSGKTIKVQLRVNYRGDVVPQVNVNVEDPSQIQVTVVRGPNQSAASGNQSNGASGSPSKNTRIAHDQAGENADDEPETAS